MRTVGLLVATVSLLIVPSVADASAGTSCKVIGQTRQVVTKKKTDYLVCSLSGKRKVWKATTPAIGTKATVLKTGGLPFINLALTVKDFAAQCVLVMKGNEVVAEWNFGNHTSNTKILVASVSKSFTNTLVGIAQKKGLVNIDDKASKFITEWA